MNIFMVNIRIILDICIFILNFRIFILNSCFMVNIWNSFLSNRALKVSYFLFQKVELNS